MSRVGCDLRQAGRVLTCGCKTPRVLPRSTKSVSLECVLGAVRRMSALDHVLHVPGKGRRSQAGVLALQFRRKRRSVGGDLEHLLGFRSDLNLTQVLNEKGST